MESVKEVWSFGDTDIRLGTTAIQTSPGNTEGRRPYVSSVEKLPVSVSRSTRERNILYTQEFLTYKDLQNIHFSKMYWYSSLGKFPRNVPSETPCSLGVRETLKTNLKRTSRRRIP